jgi:hypothetical protein
VSAKVAKTFCRPVHEKNNDEAFQCEQDDPPPHKERLNSGSIEKNAKRVKKEEEGNRCPKGKRTSTSPAPKAKNAEREEAGREPNKLYKIFVFLKSSVKRRDGGDGNCPHKDYEPD